MTAPARDPRVRHPAFFRVCLVLLGTFQLPTGVWALAAPRSWYDSFPGFGHAWIAPIGDYNEHFITDLGAALIALSVALLAAAVSLRRSVVRLALATWLVFAVPHFISHIFARGGLSALDYGLNLVTVGIAAGLPLLLLALTLHGARTPAPVSTTPEMG